MGGNGSRNGAPPTGSRGLRPLKPNAARTSLLSRRLGLNDEIDLVADIGDEGFQTEIRSVKRAARGEADCIGLVVRAHAGLIEGDLQRDRLGYSEQGQIAGHRPGLVILLSEAGANERHLREFGHIEPISALQIIVSRGELRLEASGLDDDIQRAGGGIASVETDRSAGVGKNSDHLGEAEMIDKKQNVGVV